MSPEPGPPSSSSIYQTQHLSLARIPPVPSPALASSCHHHHRARVDARKSPDPCSERRCQPFFSALTHRTASPGQRLPGHARAMRVALPPRAAKARITAATCPCAAPAGATAGRAAGAWGLGGAL